MTLPEELDYSQSGEQAVILKIAETLPVGRFLDIGAGDGVTFSNTRALALRGWGGVLVEPAPWAIERLAALYRDREDIDVVQAIVTGDKWGLIDFHYTPGDHLSTVSVAEMEKWREVQFHRMICAAVGLSDILVLAGPVSIVSIDAEGKTSELVRWLQLFDSYWDSIECLIFERDPERSAKDLVKVGAWEIAAETANNYIVRRLS